MFYEPRASISQHNGCATSAESVWSVEIGQDLQVCRHNHKLRVDKHLKCRSKSVGAPLNAIVQCEACHAE